MDRIGSAGRKAGEALLAVGLTVMVLMVFGNVVLRYAFDSGITVSEEVSRFIFVWLTFGGAMLVFAEGGHIATDGLVASLSGGGRRVVAIVANLLVVGCCVLMVIGGWRQTLINLGNVAPVSGIPKGAIYVSAVVAGFCIAALALRNVWRLLHGIQPESVAQRSLAD